MNYKNTVLAAHLKIAEDGNSWIKLNKKYLLVTGVINWLLLFSIFYLYLKEYANVFVYIMLSGISGLIGGFQLLYSQLVKQTPIIIEFLSKEKIREYLDEQN